MIIVLLGFGLISVCLWALLRRVEASEAAIRRLEVQRTTPKEAQ